MNEPKYLRPMPTVGYWAERQLMAQRKSNSSRSFFRWRNHSTTKSASESDVRDLSLGSPLASLSAPPNFHGFEPPQQRPPSSPFVSESAHVFSLQHPSTNLFSDNTQDFSSVSQSVDRDSTDSISPMHNWVPSRKTDTPPSTPRSSGSLYGKAKKSIGSKLKFRIRKEATPYSAMPEHEHQCSTVGDTRNYTTMHQITKTGSYFKDDVSRIKLRRRFFGRPPWGRKESGDSYSSVTSSVREILKGETPPPSLGSSSASLRVNCVDSPYPGGEARRIKTPPLTDGAVNCRPRSFFTETITSTDLDEVDIHGSSSRRHSLQIVCHKSYSPDSAEWREKIPKQPVRRSPHEGPAPFEFQLPEHLPSSPMCPANEKHVGGGKGVCVYHGRRKGASKMKG
ncbi:hypothetical protein FGSG_05228 [Fusarium graminearum PH-1]|uniref:Chromosome 3, complete genome n=1 Tax=Gibberella zeae (strain ATCC MYA-4620 / CBS 123657 / FGSC 9075 / NRRL 31084 / PH-1) TaxID=229533 RepID=I1RMN5_GIBZE|nr:hypothetical protein FGSG_05228 [Fusarium graminearum PH-1]ESU11163.1 hypothetical protein FGSG_05228 [Fusarium graminearum PH-1]CEF88412.1 unnamed protein product [Fusarium graminearum]|eukprot:XP_011323739.1 hypothetical protein FGSG_05228 [Fusarium graminearum PH-1]